MYQSTPRTDYFETSFVIISQIGNLQLCPIIMPIFIPSLLLYPCPATPHGQEEQEQKIKKYIDKLEKIFSLCIASRIFEIICNLGEKEKTSQPKNKSLSWFHANNVWFLFFNKLLNPKFSYAS